MQDKTKKILLAVGGIGVGCVLASTGGIFLGAALGGILLRTGAIKPNPSLATEGLKWIVPKSMILGNAARGAICSAVGIKMAAENGSDLGYVLGKDLAEESLKKARQQAEQVQVTK